MHLLKLRALIGIGSCLGVTASHVLMLGHPEFSVSAPLVNLRNMLITNFDAVLVSLVVGVILPPRRP